MEEFDTKFSIEILAKACHALGASFLRVHKKYQKEGKLEILRKHAFLEKSVFHK